MLKCVCVCVCVFEKGIKSVGKKVRECVCVVSVHVFVCKRVNYCVSASECGCGCECARVYNF